jgi:hypothetical protein
MVGRGRGRGNAVSFNIEQLGLVEVKQVQFLLNTTNEIKEIQQYSKK